MPRPLPPPMNVQPLDPVRRLVSRWRRRLRTPGRPGPSPAPVRRARPPDVTRPPGRGRPAAAPRRAPPDRPPRPGPALAPPPRASPPALATSKASNTLPGPTADAARRREPPRPISGFDAPAPAQTRAERPSGRRHARQTRPSSLYYPSNHRRPRSATTRGRARRNRLAVLRRAAVRAAPVGRVPLAARPLRRRGTPVSQPQAPAALDGALPAPLGRREQGSEALGAPAAGANARRAHFSLWPAAQGSWLSSPGAPAPDASPAPSPGPKSRGCSLSVPL